MPRFGLYLMMAFLALLPLPLGGAPAQAAETSKEEQAKEGSGLPLPRFASLRSGEVNLRTGPGTRYPIDWVYVHKGLPLEITAEYDVWRRVRDFEGTEGWVHKSALTGKRTGIVLGTSQDLRAEEKTEAPIRAHLEAETTFQIQSCSATWCKVKVDGIKGFLPKTAFWGAYPAEVF